MELLPPQARVITALLLPPCRHYVAAAGVAADIIAAARPPRHTPMRKSIALMLPRYAIRAMLERDVVYARDYTLRAIIADALILHTPLKMIATERCCCAIRASVTLLA